MSHALMVLGFSEMMDEDQPPEEIWLNDERLMEHFDELKRRRGKGKDDDDDELIPGAEWQQNDLTRGLRR